MPVRVKPFGSVLVRERSRRIEAAAARSVRVCTRYPRPTHKETAERSAGQGGEGAGWGDEGHSEAAAEERRKKGERERERRGIESSSAARVPLRAGTAGSPLVVYTRHNGLKEPAPKSS